jgi:PAS domain S-box-containing protein
MKKFISPRVSIGFAITLIVSIVNVCFASQRIATITENTQLTIERDRVLDILCVMLAALKDYEMGQQRYLLTNNGQYLASHRIDLARIRIQLKSLVELKLDEQKLVPFEKEIDRELRELTTIIDSQSEQLRTTDLSPRISSKGQSLLAQRGQQLVDEIRQMIVSLESSERIVLDQLQTESQQSLVDTKIAFVISGLLNLLLLILFYQLVTWDLTKRQQVESKLQDYVAEFEELYHSAPCGYHSLDPLGKFTRINRTELEMLGYEEAEIIGQKSFADLLTVESAQIFRRNFQLIKSRGWMRDLEFQMVHKDGWIVPVSATAIVVKDAAGNYLTSRSTVIDISDRMRLRQQNQLSAEISQKIRQSLQLDEILQTAVEEVQKLLGVDRVLIFRLEADGTGTVVQEQVLPDYPVVMGQNILDPCFDRSYHDSYQQGLIHSVADITQAGFQPCYVEFLQRLAVKASSIVPIHLRDELWGLLIVHHCQAPRQWQPQEVEMMARLATQMGIALAQAELLGQEQSQRQELARSNAELEQFAHIASHDLQEPLRMVISYLQLLERRYQGKLDADADEFINYAVDGAVRMQALIQALLSYARVSSHGQQFELVKCDRVLQDAIANLHVAITESNAVITSDPLPEVWGDATQLTQLFQNLIANALKFRREISPQIRISVQQLGSTAALSTDLREPPPNDDIAADPSAWQISVADNGIGIEAQYLDRIFVIFQRLHPRVNYPGTGIGLAICKKIVERHGGKIWVESIPEACASSNDEACATNCVVSGSIFSFIIPGVGSISPQHAHK